MAAPPNFTSCPCAQNVPAASGDSHILLPLTEEYNYFMLTVSIVTSFGGIIQAVEILQRKVDNRVSMWAWFLSFSGNVCWILYGLMVADMSVLASSAIGGFGALLTIVCEQAINERSAYNRCRHYHRLEEETDWCGTCTSKSVCSGCCSCLCSWKADEDDNEEEDETP